MKNIFLNYNSLLELKHDVLFMICKMQTTFTNLLIFFFSF